MGAWGHEFNANDDAADWLAEFEEAPSWTTVANALKLKSDYIEADAASNAIAAAELVAAGLGNPHSDLTPEIGEWIAANSQGSGPLKELALAAVLTVLNGSELQELWDEAEDASWRDEVSNLQTRLS
jgi:hypothetical protein